MSFTKDKPKTLVERKLVFFCTGFIEISMGIVMNFSISSALLPGHCVIMVISVLVTSGNASMGIFLYVMMPPINKTTVANKIKYFRFNENAIIDFRIFNMNIFLRFKNLLRYKLIPYLSRLFYLLPLSHLIYSSDFHYCLLSAQV